MLRRSVIEGKAALRYCSGMRLLPLLSIPLLGVIGVAAVHAAAPTGKAHPPAPIGSIGQWFGAEGYPPDAMRANEQGRVGVKLSIDAAGKPASCAVVVSSGSFALDSATCAIAMEHLTFTPAADDNGHATNGVYSFATRWVIPKDAVQPAANDTPVPVTRDQ